MNKCFILPGNISVYLDNNSTIISAYRDIPVYAGQEEERDSWDDDFDPFEIIGYEAVALSSTEIASILRLIRSVNLSCE